MGTQDCVIADFQDVGLSSRGGTTVQALRAARAHVLHQVLLLCAGMMESSEPHSSVPSDNVFLTSLSALGLTTPLLYLYLDLFVTIHVHSSLESGRACTYANYARWSTEYGVCIMELEYNMENGMWNVEHGLFNMEHRVRTARIWRAWGMQYEAWSTD